MPTSGWSFSHILTTGVFFELSVKQIQQLSRRADLSKLTVVLMIDNGMFCVDKSSLFYFAAFIISYKQSAYKNFYSKSNCLAVSCLKLYLSVSSNSIRGTCES